MIGYCTRQCASRQDKIVYRSKVNQLLFSDKKQICLVMASTFTILKYDETKSSARYKAVMNDGQLVVAHLQNVDTLLDAPLSQLSLCPGVPESVMGFSSSSITKFLIEKIEDEIIYR